MCCRVVGQVAVPFHTQGIPLGHPISYYANDVGRVLSLRGSHGTSLANPARFVLSLNRRDLKTSFSVCSNHSRHRRRRRSSHKTCRVHRRSVETGSSADAVLKHHTRSLTASRLALPHAALLTLKRGQICGNGSTLVVSTLGRPCLQVTRRSRVPRPRKSVARVWFLSRKVNQGPQVTQKE